MEAANPQSTEIEEPGPGPAEDETNLLHEIDFYVWDVKLVWALPIPAEEMPISQLAWHLRQPLLSSHPNGSFDLMPGDVIADPLLYPNENQRIVNADTGYPIDILRWEQRQRWLIIDGLHRLMKHFLLGSQTVQVRKIPESLVPKVPVYNTTYYH